MHTRPGHENFSRWLLSLGGGLLVADLRPPVRDVVEVPAHALTVRGCLIEDVFTNTTSEEVPWVKGENKVIETVSLGKS